MIDTNEMRIYAKHFNESGRFAASTLIDQAADEIDLLREALAHIHMYTLDKVTARDRILHIIDRIVQNAFKGESTHE